MEKIKKIDIHAHVNPFTRFTKESIYPLISPEDLLDYYEKLNVEKGILLPIVSQEGSGDILPNQYVMLAKEQYPDRFYWFCNVDPRALSNSDKTDFTEILNFYKENGAKGYGELTSNVYFDDPKLDNLFSQLEELDMPVIFHTSPYPGYNYGAVDEMNFPRLEKMLKKHKNLKFIGHSQPFWAHISADLKEEERNGFPTGKVIPGRIHQLLKDYGNLYCDISANSGRNAMMRDRDHAIRFFTEFSDRIFYGCDICNLGSVIHYQFCDFLDEMYESGELDAKVYKKIVRENALNILKLEK